MDACNRIPLWKYVAYVPGLLNRRPKFRHLSFSLLRRAFLRFHSQVETVWLEFLHDFLNESSSGWRNSEIIPLSRRLLVHIRDQVNNDHRGVPVLSSVLAIQWKKTTHDLNGEKISKSNRQPRPDIIVYVGWRSPFTDKGPSRSTTKQQQAQQPLKKRAEMRKEAKSHKLSTKSEWFHLFSTRKKKHQFRWSIMGRSS